MTQQNTKTPAMVLQEFTVKNRYSPPEYVLTLSKTGTHEDEFHYKVRVANTWGYGFGRSKQVAKQNAASNALDMLAKEGLYDPSTNPAQDFNAQSHRNESDNPFKPPINFIGSLNDMCCEHKLSCPLFTEISNVGPPHCREFTYECKVGLLVTQAAANTKKQAKQLAARDMLDKIRDICRKAKEYAKEDNVKKEGVKTASQAEVIFLCIEAKMKEYKDYLPKEECDRLKKEIVKVRERIRSGDAADPEEIRYVTDTLKISLFKLFEMTLNELIAERQSDSGSISSCDSPSKQTKEKK